MKKTKRKLKRLTSADKKCRKRCLRLAESGLSVAEVMKREKINRKYLERILHGTYAFRKYAARSRKMEFDYLYESMFSLSKYLKRIPLLKEMRSEGISQKVAHKIQLKLEKVGFKRKRIDYYSDSLLIKDLRRIQRLTKRKPIFPDVKKHSQYSIGTYYRRFGSMENIRRAAEGKLVSMK